MGVDQGPTNLEPNLTLFLFVDRDESQHKYSKELRRTFPSSGYEVVVPSDTSSGTSILSPISSSGSLQGYPLALDIPFLPN